MPTDGRDITGEVNSSVHGHHGTFYLALKRGVIHPLFIGPVGTSEPNVLLSADDRVVRASNQLSDEFPFNLDFNSGDTIGIGAVILKFRSILMNSLCRVGTEDG